MLQGEDEGPSFILISYSMLLVSYHDTNGVLKIRLLSSSNKKTRRADKQLKTASFSMLKILLETLKEFMLPEKNNYLF